MLVLTRRVGEAIVIDLDIRITIAVIQGDRVRIGVSAPKTIRVDREEVHRRRAKLAAGPRGRLLASAGT